MMQAKIAPKTRPCPHPGELSAVGLPDDLIDNQGRQNVVAEDSLGKAARKMIMILCEGVEIMHTFRKWKVHEHLT
jgi:hypothetical protein